MFFVPLLSFLLAPHPHWTVSAVNDDAIPVVIYVSTTGSDTQGNNGTDPAHPLLTPRAAKLAASAIRHTRPTQKITIYFLGFESGARVGKCMVSEDD